MSVCVCNTHTQSPNISEHLTITLVIHIPFHNYVQLYGAVSVFVSVCAHSVKRALCRSEQATGTPPLQTYQTMPW